MIKKTIKIVLLFISVIIIFLIIIAFAPGVWKHWVTYPKYDKEIVELQKLRKEPSPVTNLKTWRGVMHAHSYLSHDSRGTLNDIIPAAKADGIDFVFLTDHPKGDIDTIPKGYKGYYEGVLIEPGSEKQGFDCWPLDSTIIDWRVDKDKIAKNIITKGGIIFYAHTEEPHNWSNPDFQGMEIYNFHTDTRDQSPVPVLFNMIVNGNKYRHWALREFFDEQTTILSRWDSLNMIRKIVGFSAVDSHENQNIRARYLQDGRVLWVGNNNHVIDTTQVKFWHKWIFSDPDTSGWVFKLMVDTYLSGFNYITNYVLAEDLTARSLAEHMKKGHLFTAFKTLGDAKGFQYFAKNQNDSICAILGDSVKVAGAKTLVAVSPLPGQFRLIHDGKIVNVSKEEKYEFISSRALEKGAYRIEIHLKLQGKLIPWLYSNPIYIY